MSPILARYLRPPAPRTRNRALRLFSTSLLRAQSPLPASIPYTQSCPSPTCACAPTPPNLDIDRTSPLLNTMASYAEQVLICTGKDDWNSNIENEDGATGAFVKGLKGVIGRGGAGFDPFNNVLVTASSFPASPTPDTTTALLFPAFKRIRELPHTPEVFNNLATAYLKSKTLNSFHNNLPADQKAQLLRDESAASNIPPAEPITHPVILICGHGGRDQRCGVLGPMLREAFTKELERRKIQCEIGVISHIGGHKYAGNVIIYIPPGTSAERETESHTSGSVLEGTGIWYGRVAPENVEGIVEETIIKGRVVFDLLRGGIMRDGRNLGRLLEEQMKRERGEVEEEGGLKLKPSVRR